MGRCKLSMGAVVVEVRDEPKVLLGKVPLEVLGEFVVFGALLPVCAGTLWPGGWAFMALFFSLALAIVNLAGPQRA